MDEGDFVDSFDGEIIDCEGNYLSPGFIDTHVHGGGGHFHASCCELDTDAQTAREIMERTAKEFLEKENAQ